MFLCGDPFGVWEGNPLNNPIFAFNRDSIFDVDRDSIFVRSFTAKADTTYEEQWIG